MKKFTVALIALALVCSSVFAGISVTAGAGFGGQMVPIKVEDKTLTNALVYLADIKEPETGDTVPVSFRSTFASAFAGVDYVLDNNITVYGDTSFGLVLSNSVRKSLPSSKTFVLSQSIGAGYTFDLENNISVFTGAGFSYRFAMGSSIGSNKVSAFGVGLRAKATYMIDEHWGISFQINPTFDFSVSVTEEKYTTESDAYLESSAEKYPTFPYDGKASEKAELYGTNKVIYDFQANRIANRVFQLVGSNEKMMLVSGGAYIGATYKF